MAAAVLQTASVPVSNPFHMASHQRITVNSSVPPQVSSSSRPQPPPSSVSASPPEQSTKTFHRLRSTLEQSIRTATRSKKASSPSPNDLATVTVRNSKGKERAATEEVLKEKDKSGMFRKLESKVTFRRGRESVTPTPPSVSSSAAGNEVRAAGFVPFNSPSLRQASMSSPSLHLSSQALPSPKSRSAVPVSSSASNAALVSPPRDRTRGSSLQSAQREVSSPVPLGTKREPRANGHAPPLPPQTPPRETVSRHRSTKSAPISLPSSASTPSLPPPSRSQHIIPDASKRHRDLPSPPDSPTPASGSRAQLTRSSSRTAAASSGHLPLSSSPPPLSPITPSTSSPIRTRSPSTRRVVSPSRRGLSSPSASNLPTTSNNPSPTPHRPSVDSPRRPSVESSRRVSGDSPGGNREESPSPIRPRPISPGQRSYAQNRHINMSSVSLSISPSNPEHRELIRTATSMLCKEIVKPPVHVNRSESVMRDWEEVEVRTRALARLERVWGKSGGVASGSSTNLGSAAGMTSSGLSVAGEERERRLFCEALRDGFVLCQLINKLRSSSVVRPDIREDGIVRTSNVTKFLAACSSYGLPDEDLFQRDDFMEGTGESLARVAHTIIALIKFVDAPVIDRSKYLSGQVKKTSSPSTTSGPYSQGSVSRGTASTPNLARGSSSPLPPSPTARRRWSPPTGLPTVRSNSPNDATGAQKHLDNLADQDGNSRGNDRGVSLIKPPPRSPLRVRNIQKADDGGLFSWAINAASPSRSPTAGPPQALIGDPSVNESPDESRDLRQSVASSAMTETTVTTAISSILDRQRTNSSSYNKYGTIRTVTTDLTSEAPSISRAEGSIIASDLASKSGKDNGSKPSRERKASEAPVVDLSRVAEETDESVSSKGQTRDKGKGKSNGVEQVKSQEATEKAAVHLHKGKWPDDFLNAFQARSQPRPIATISRTPDLEDLPNASSPISISPPRKLAIVGASRRNESHEELPQFPRRPTHRARHSVDAPVLKPKESILRRDVSPDGVSGPSKVMLRRHSTKPAVPHRNGIYVARINTEGSDNDPVPFPRATSGEHSGGSPSPRNSSGDDPSASNKPRLPRGRFQSEIEGAGSNRRGRPEPYGELGARPSRSRFESMVNLGVASSTASASDLISRDSMDGSAVRKTLVLKEDGKPPTHFQLGNCIGRGQFGSVYRALNLNTGQMVAVKRIRLEGLKEDEVTTLMREVDLVKSLSHPSIVKYEGMARDADTLSIILEYAENGSLGQTLKAFGKLNERLVASYVVKILEGLHYLHQSDVVHCDLKAANILTTKNGNVKLSDFGVSLNLRAMEREIKDVAGTPNWMAPEVIELKGASTKSDIWSLACTVIELLTGRPPYAEIANSMSVMFRIVEDDMPPIPDGCSEMLQDFLVQCFNKDPSLRPSADLLCEHPWLKKNWGAHKELRPQDSIPFLRRVSADLHKSDVVRYFSQIDMPESPASDGFQRADDVNPPLDRHMSNSSMRPMTDSEISPREHSFVKTTFSKPMVCRVCLLSVKKSAVLCAQCSLIAHSKCAINALPTCDLRAQLLLYAQYAEKGNPASVYSNPSDNMSEVQPASPSSDVPYIAHSPRTSIDGAPNPQSPTHLVHPPTAFKFMAAFKRSRSNLSPEPGLPSSAPQSTDRDEPGKRKAAIPHVKQMHERPLSFASASTDPNTSSLRSAATAAESFSSQRRSHLSNGTQGSAVSAVGKSEEPKSSKITSTSRASASIADQDEARPNIPGSLPPADSRRHRKRESKPSNCIVQ